TIYGFASIRNGLLFTKNPEIKQKYIRISNACIRISKIRIQRRSLFIQIETLVRPFLSILALVETPSKVHFICSRILGPAMRKLIAVRFIQLKRKCFGDARGQSVLQ